MCFKNGTTQGSKQWRIYILTVCFSFKSCEKDPISHVRLFLDLFKFTTLWEMQYQHLPSKSELDPMLEVHWGSYMGWLTHLNPLPFCLLTHIGKMVLAIHFQMRNAMTLSPKLILPCAHVCQSLIHLNLFSEFTGLRQDLHFWSWPSVH